MTAATQSTLLNPDRRFFEFLSLLRGIAVLMVVYDHLGAVWPLANGMAWGPNEFIRRWVTEPLAIIQDFGFLGVVTFFLISGFVITHVAQREARYEFAIKRILRIYPPLIVSILAVIAITAIRGGDLLTWKQYLFSFSLLNYVRAPSYVVNGVAWTLVIEMLFYLGVFLVLPLIKKKPFVAVSILIAAVAAVIWQSRSLGASFFLLAASVAYLPFLIQGQLIYLRWARKLSVRSYAVLAIATYVITVYGIRTIHTLYYPADNSYMISFAYAFTVFVAGLLLEAIIRVPRFIRFSSDISYSLYLFHGIIGFLVLDIVARRLNLTLSIALAFGAAMGIAYLSYRFVEKPSQTIARRMIASIKQRTNRVQADQS